MRIRMEVRSGSGILEDIRETPDISEIKLEKLIGSLKKDIVRYMRFGMIVSFKRI